ncbi:MAG: hypothetical protein R3C26_01005 [Calditrichia bacterium]
MHVDAHHTIEDAGIVLGEVLKAALGDKRGIKRAGFWMYLVDEALAQCCAGFIRSPVLVWDVDFPPAIGDFPTELFEDFFGIYQRARRKCACKVHYGRSDHHKIEAVFKALTIATKENRLRN